MKRELTNVEHGSDFSESIYRYRIGDMAYILEDMLRALKKHCSEDFDERFVIDPDQYSRILDTIETCSKSSHHAYDNPAYKELENLAAFGQVAVSIAMSFIVTVEGIKFEMDIDDMSNGKEI